MDKDNFRAQWELEAGEEPAWTAHSFVTLDRSPQVPECPLQILSSVGREAAGILGVGEQAMKRRQSWAVEAALLVTTLLVTYVRT